MPKQQRFQRLPNVVVTPMLRDHVDGVELSVDVKERQNSMCDALPHVMKREHDVSLVKLCVRMHRAVDDALIVSKHDAFAMNWDTKTAKGDAQI